MNSWKASSNDKGIDKKKKPIANKQIEEIEYEQINSRTVPVKEEKKVENIHRDGFMLIEEEKKEETVNDINNFDLGLDNEAD